MNEIKYIILTIIIFIAVGIETDIYLPAFIDMMSYFSVSEEQIQSLLTWNFIGIFFVCPLYGPVSDSFGRRKPMMVALGLFFLGSIITIIAESFQWMLFGRLLQGLGSGGCLTLGTACFFDVFKAEKAVKALSTINSIFPFIMAAAPLIGGYLNHTFGFRSNFIAIALLVLISLFVFIFFFDETLPKEKRKAFHTKKILNDFKMALTSVPFWQTIIIVCLPFAAYLVFLSGISILFVLEFGVEKLSLPYFQVAILSAWLIGSLSCSKAIKLWGIPTMKVVGTASLVIGAVSLGIVALIAPENPYLLTGTTLFYTFGANWSQGVYFPEGMEILPEIKGVTSSILQSARLLLTAVIVAIGSMAYNGTIYPIVVLIVGITAVVLLTTILYERKKLVLAKTGNEDAAASL